MKKLLNIWQTFIFSNLMIAFAAAFQSLLTYQVLEIPINRYMVLFELSSTLLLYNLSMWLSMPRKIEDSKQARTIWYFKYKLFFYLLSILALFTLVYSITHLHIYTIALLVIISLLSLGYALPFLKFGKKKYSLRQIVGLKVFLIAIVWSLSVVGMPITEYYSSYNELPNQSLLWLGLVFLFILSITIPFDIRDVKQDKYFGIRTIPVLFGVERSKHMCYLLLIIHASLLFFSAIAAKEILIIIDFLVLALLYFSIFKKNDSYIRVYILDFVLIIQFILVFLY